MTPSLSLKLIIGFSLVGLAISVYALLHNAGFASGAFCTISATVNCDIVNKGPYAQVAGIPVALIGLLGYGFLCLAALLKFKHPEDKQLSWFLILASVGGLLFSLYLTGVEAFVLRAWCVLCLTSQFLILAILVCSFLSMGPRTK